MGMAAVTGEARERAILLIRLAAVALGSTLVLLAGTGVLSFAAAVLLLYLAAAVVLRYSRSSRRLTYVGPVVDLVAVTALALAFPLDLAPWILYTFAIGATALRFGPVGAVASTAFAVVGFDAALGARGESARATDLWAVQALIAIGLVTAEIAWALARENADVGWSRGHARALAILMRQREPAELLRAVATELAHVPGVRGAWIWSSANDQRLRIIASAGAVPAAETVVSADALRVLSAEGPLDRIVPELEGLTFPLSTEPSLIAAVAIDGAAPDRATIGGAVHDLVGDSAQLVAAAYDRTRTSADAHANELALRAIESIQGQRSQPALIASTLIETGELGGGRASIVRLSDGGTIAGDLPGDRIMALARDRRLPAVAAEGDLHVALVPLGEGRLLAVDGPLERLNARLPHLVRVAHAARERLALLAERDRFQRAAHELGRDVEHLGGELRAREDALANAVHELKNPLTAVHGYATLMSRNLHSVQGQLAQLERLMADLLSAERNQAAQQESSVDAVADAREAIGRARVRSNADIELDAPAGPVQLAIDPARFAQLLDNLLANASKYSPGSAPITVRIEKDGQEGRVAVIDEGIGIGPEHLERVFERFYRVGGEAVAGQGLGLSICKEIVTSHGGRIWAASQGPGKGSTFTFALPLAPEPVRT
jgi:signal transduction histidine kinase